MNTGTAFLKNTWYVAAWSHEIAADGMVARTIIGVPLLFWRDAGGTVVALDDRCCHRAAPLSKGRREGDNIRCMYHGLLFDKSGKCVEIPSQEFIPPAAKVRAYPVVERFKWVWIWMGEPDKADPSLIPDTHYLDDAGWRGTPGYMHYAANYLLITDNLLDFSHLSYVHETTLGGNSKYAGIRPKVTRNGHGVRVERWLIDDEPAPFLRKLKNLAREERGSLEHLRRGASRRIVDGLGQRPHRHRCALGRAHRRRAVLRLPGGNAGDLQYVALFFPAVAWLCAR